MASESPKVTCGSPPLVRERKATRVPVLTWNKTHRLVGEHPLEYREHADLWDGEVLDSRSNSSRRVAIKVFRGGRTIDEPRTKANLKQALESRSRHWKTFRHDNIARFHDLTFCAEDILMPALVFDFYPNGNINNFLREHSLDDNRKLSLIKEIACGLRYLHKFHPPIVHGDIRGSNVLIDAEGHAVLADCELVFITASPDFTASVSLHTARWTAPELMEPCGHDMERATAPYSLSSDVFAFAMTVIEVFTEKLPFAGIRRDSAVSPAILQGKRPDVPAFIQEQAKFASLIQICWDANPKSRPPADGICTVLENYPTDDSTFPGRLESLSQEQCAECPLSSTPQGSTLDPCGL